MADGVLPLPCERAGASTDAKTRSIRLPTHSTRKPQHRCETGPQGVDFFAPMKRVLLACRTMAETAEAPPLRHPLAFGISRFPETPSNAKPRTCKMLGRVCTRPFLQPHAFPHLAGVSSALKPPLPPCLQPEPWSVSLCGGVDTRNGEGERASRNTPSSSDRGGVEGPGIRYMAPSC